MNLECDPYPIWNQAPYHDGLASIVCWEPLYIHMYSCTWSNVRSLNRKFNLCNHKPELFRSRLSLKVFQVKGEKREKIPKYPPTHSHGGLSFVFSKDGIPVFLFGIKERTVGQWFLWPARLDLLELTNVLEMNVCLVSGGVLVREESSSDEEALSSVHAGTSITHESGHLIFSWPSKTILIIIVSSLALSLIVVVVIGVICRIQCRMTTHAGSRMTTSSSSQEILAGKSSIVGASSSSLLLSQHHGRDRLPEGSGQDDSDLDLPINEGKNPPNSGKSNSEASVQDATFQFRATR